MKDIGVDVIGLDWTVDMDDGRRHVGDGLSVQGNVCPGYLFPPLPVLTDGILMGACMVVIISPAVNYFLDNHINMADIIFNGVACFLVAAILGTRVYSSNVADIKEKLNRSKKWAKWRYGNKQSTSTERKPWTRKIELCQLAVMSVLSFLHRQPA